MPFGKILIVEDEPEIIKALEMRLTAAGYEVVSAMDGLSATQVAMREEPDLVLLDIGLPGGDGHTVAARLQENVKTKSIPVIYLTAKSSQDDMKRASELGAAGFLMKPFDPQRLIDLVTKVIVGAPADSG